MKPKIRSHLLAVWGALLISTALIPVDVRAQDPTCADWKSWDEEIFLFKLGYVRGMGARDIMDILEIFEPESVSKEFPPNVSYLLGTSPERDGLRSSLLGDIFDEYCNPASNRHVRLTDLQIILPFKLWASPGFIDLLFEFVFTGDRGGLRAFLTDPATDSLVYRY